MRLSLRPLWLAALVLAGCAESATSSRPARELDDYRYNLQMTCFCTSEQTQPVVIEVRDGEVTQVRSRRTGEDLTRRGQWPTIADLFDHIEAAERTGNQHLVVKYDPALGYPTHLEIGSLANDSGIIFTAGNLRPL